jgi:serine/threonine protein kinase
VDEAGDSTFPNWPEFRRLFAYDNLLGKVVGGRYEIVRRLGAGGMGVVFLARHIHLDKPFALKIISPRFLDEPEIGQRFLLEARAASKIDHPNVVSITDFGPPEEGPAFFAMEHLGGEDLAQMLAREGPMSWRRVLPIVTQIARALAAAHQRGVVHRDIKPQNCFRITRDDNPDFIKVLDFGLAKVLSGTGNSAWTVGGSPGYIAPEIYRGGRTDHRVDIYALGVLMHTLLIGRLPAQAPEDVELPPGAPVLQLADLPAELRSVVAQAMHDDPGQRHASAEALLVALEQARVALERPPVPGDRSPEIRGGWRRWPLLAATTAGALVVTAVLAWGRPDAPGGAGETGGAVAASAIDSAGPDGAGVNGSDGAGATAATSPRVAGDGGQPVSARPVPKDSGPVPSSATTGSDSEPGPSDGGPVAASATGSDSTPVAASATGSDSGPVPSSATGSDSGSKPVAPDGPGGPDPTGERPRPRPAVFDEKAARALLQRSAGRVAACKADSSFRGMATTVRLTGTVTVTPRGRASVALPPGYDVNACIERVVGDLQFRASAAGGQFTHVFLL